MKPRLILVMMALGILTLLLGLGVGIGIVWADVMSCDPQPFDVIMATPFSSRIDHVGDPLQAVLSHELRLSESQMLPSGAMLRGTVTGIRPSAPHESGQIQVRFTQALGPDGEVPITIHADLATMDGWLRQSDADTPVWHVSLNHSTRLLNMMIQRRLGPDRAVWAQILGIHENVIPDPSTDEFMLQYHRHDVLVGAGDRLTLLLRCLRP